MENVIARSIFSEATGFIRRGGFAWTCNPYVGCTFGCTYCYAMFLPQNRKPKLDWGKWFVAKANAVALAQKHAPKLAGQSVYMSSVTDPYLPAEKSIRLTRGIIEALLPHQPRLLIQTRGPLVERDIDLLKQFRHLRIHFSIPTDDDAIRSAFEPHAPPLDERWRVLNQLQAHKLPIGLCVTPMLPLANPDQFAQRLIQFQPNLLVLQDFHDSQGRWGADTGPIAKEQLLRYPKLSDTYRSLLTQLQAKRKVYEGQAGFFPP